MSELVELFFLHMYNHSEVYHIAYYIYIYIIFISLHRLLAIDLVSSLVRKIIAIMCFFSSSDTNVVLV